MKNVDQANSLVFENVAVSVQIRHTAQHQKSLTALPVSVVAPMTLIATTLKFSILTHVSVSVLKLVMSQKSRTQIVVSVVAGKIYSVIIRRF